MRLVHALVAEDAADLEHALIAAHEQALQVQLGGDAQVALLVERVEVRDERLRGGAALDGLQDGRLHLHVAVVLHVTAESADDRRALAEGLAHVVVHDEVHVALAVTGLLVGEAVELLGQRAHCLGEQRQALRGDGELAALGAHDHTRHVDDIAQVQVLQQSPVLLAHLVDAAEELNLGGGVAHHHEGDLALAALGHDAATDAHHVIGVFACLEVGILGLDVDDMRRNLGMLRIRIAAGLHDGSALGQAMGALVIQRRHRLRRVLRALLRLAHILLLLAICGPHVPRTSCKTR